jgi:hypothetical protein
MDTAAPSRKSPDAGGIGIELFHVNEPSILLMDEPFGALDVQTKAIMSNELLSLWDYTQPSVIFVTHDLEEAIALADRVVVMTAGPGTVKAVYDVDLPRPRGESRRSASNRASWNSTTRSGSHCARRYSAPTRATPSPRWPPRPHSSPGPGLVPGPGWVASSPRLPPSLSWVARSPGLQRTSP